MNFLAILQLITEVSTLEDGDDNHYCEEDLSTDHVGSTVDIWKFSY